MLELPDLKALQQLKARIAEYEKLLAERSQVDKRLQALAAELGRAGAHAPQPKRRWKMTPAQRKKHREAVRQSWAKRKGKAKANTATAAPASRSTVGPSALEAKRPASGKGPRQGSGKPRAKPATAPARMAA